MSEIAVTEQEMPEEEVLSLNEKTLDTPNWQQEDEDLALLTSDIQIKNMKQELEHYKDDMQGLVQYLYEQKMFSPKKIKKLFGAGKENEKRVKEFQKYLWVAVDGKFGPKSFAKLKEKWISLWYKEFWETGRTLSAQERTAYEKQLAADKKKYGSTAAISNYNPGNMRSPGDLGKSKSRYGVFSSPEKGYQAMLDQIEKIKSWESKRYNPEQSLAQIRCVWTQGRIVKEKVAGYKSWAKNVLRSMGKSAQEAEQLWNTLPVKDIPTKYIAEWIARYEDHKMYQLLNDRGITEGVAKSKRA